MRFFGLAVGVALATATFGATSANASVSAPTMKVTVTAVSGGFRVCGTGAADNVGEWVFTVTGDRSDGSQINESATSFGPAVSQCRNVMKSGATAGQFTATLEFAGVGLHVAGHANRTGGWAPVLGDYDFGQ